MDEEEECGDLDGSLTEKKSAFPLPCPRVINDYPSVTERYFDPRFFAPKLAKKFTSMGLLVGDQCVLFHSNRIALVSLAPSHPLLKEKKVIKEIDFQINHKLSRLDNKVSGKHKKGGQMVAATSLICSVICEDSTCYAMLAGINGTLVEVNEKLVTNPSLLRESPWAEGHIAIVLSSFKSFKTQKNDLMTYKEFYHPAE